MDKIFLISVTSFFVCLVVVPITIRIFRTINLLDAPDNRKLHTAETPSMGGIAIFTGVFVASLFWMSWVDITAYRYLIASVFLMFLLGVRDDIVMLRARHKLLAQIAICSIVIVFADIRFESFYGIFNIYEFPYWASYLITLFTLIVITNSYNLIDGIDGLAGAIATLVLGFYTFWFYSVGDIALSLICCAFVGAIMAFLYFNWQPSRIFMGDTGSMLIGFFLAIVSVYFINSNYYLSPTIPVKFPAHISIAVGLLIVPLFDTIRVFTIRISNKRSPMVPDRKHLHHLLIQLGLSHSSATLILLTTNVLFFALSFLLQPYGNSLSIIVLICLALGLSFLLKRIHTKYGVDEEKEVAEHRKQIFLSKSA